MSEYTRDNGYVCEYDDYSYPQQSIEVTPENRAEYNRALAEFWEEMDALYAQTH